MKLEQPYKPKYWVVHDKTKDDVFDSTMHKTKSASLDLFFCNHAYDYGKEMIEDDLLEAWFDGKEDLECILIEIKIVSNQPIQSLGEYHD